MTDRLYPIEPQSIPYPRPRLLDLFILIYILVFFAELLFGYVTGYFNYLISGYYRSFDGTISLESWIIIISGTTSIGVSMLGSLFSILSINSKLRYGILIRLSLIWNIVMIALGLIIVIIEGNFFLIRLSLVFFIIFSCMIYIAYYHEPTKQYLSQKSEMSREQLLKLLRDKDTEIMKLREENDNSRSIDLTIEHN